MFLDNQHKRGRSVIGFAEIILSRGCGRMARSEEATRHDWLNSLQKCIFIGQEYMPITRQDFKAQEVVSETSVQACA